MVMKLYRFELLFFDGIVITGKILHWCAVKHPVFLALQIFYQNYIILEKVDIIENLVYIKRGEQCFVLLPVHIVLPPTPKLTMDC